jgi:hypothetical protein
VFRRCVFPGCTVPYRFCEIHHRHWWSHGGHTDLALLLPYCWAHHHFLHEYGFTVQVDPDTARLLHRRPDGRAIGDPDHPLAEAIGQLTLRVEADHPPPASEASSRRPSPRPEPAVTPGHARHRDPHPRTERPRRLAGSSEDPTRAGQTGAPGMRPSGG